MTDDTFPSRALLTCRALADAGYKPYSRIVVDGKRMEAISMPFPQDDGKVGLMIREPGDPTTMVEWIMPWNAVRSALKRSE